MRPKFQVHPKENLFLSVILANLSLPESVQSIILSNAFGRVAGATHADLKFGTGTRWGCSSGQEDKAEPRVCECGTKPAKAARPCQCLPQKPSGGRSILRPIYHSGCVIQCILQQRLTGTVSLRRDDVWLLSTQIVAFT